MSDELTSTGNFEAVAPQMKWMPRWFREHFSVTAARTIAVLLFSAGALIANWQWRIKDMERTIAAGQNVQEKQADSFGKQTDALNGINVQLGKLDATLQGLDTRLKQQEEWRTRVEQTAEQIHVPKASYRGARKRESDGR